MADQPSRGGQKLHHDGSFRKYMELKNHKLQEQFAHHKEVVGQTPADPALQTLFNGICIHINGLTTPSHQELKHIMALYGGRFELYYHRAVVTHIIATHLPTAKVKQFERARDPVPIVKPDWIVQSIHHKRLLPWQDFQLTQLSTAPGQSTLQGFASHGHASAEALRPVAAAAVAACVSPKEPTPCKPKGGQRSTLDTCAASGSAAAAASGSAAAAASGSAAAAASGSAAATATTSSPATSLPATSSPATSLPATSLPATTATAPQPATSPPPPTTSPPPPATSPPPPTTSPPTSLPPSIEPAQLQRAQAIAARARAACDVLRGRPSTSADDPNFMATFFKSSRLHFIGRWQSRIENLAHQLAANAPQPTEAGGAVGPRTIIHIDMDCFFASVAALTDESFRGLPLVVSHSASASGTGEVSAANYEARAFGIHAGMLIAAAKRACPHLVVMPYQFDRYTEVSEAAFRILWQYTALVQPVSCDEAYMDVTGLGDPQAIANAVRADILAATQCTASAGIGPNMLLAKLATRRAKPNGVFHLTPAHANTFVAALPAEDLPGVGWSLRRRLATMGIVSVSDIRSRSQAALQAALGDKTGAALWAHAHGRDDRPVSLPAPRKSIGAEVNWGIRFQSQDDALSFVQALAGEVAARMKDAHVRGKTVTLKIKRRKQGAPSAAKFLGHGPCDNLSRSVTAHVFVSQGVEIGRCACALLKAMKLPPDQIRGVGIAVSKLDTDPASHNARAHAPHPARLQAPRSPTAFRTEDYAWWHGDWSPKHTEQPNTLLRMWGHEKRGDGGLEEGGVHDEDDEMADMDGEDDNRGHAQAGGGVDDGGHKPNAHHQRPNAHHQRPNAHHQRPNAHHQRPNAHQHPQDAETAVGIHHSPAATPRAPTLTLSQVDPAVLAELPPAIQQELLSALRRTALADLPQQRRLDAMLEASPSSAGKPVKTPGVDRQGSQAIDMEVLRQLPADIRREVEASMAPPAKRQRIATAHARRSQRRLDYATAKHRHPLTASQIDPATLAELPLSLQQEVLAGIHGGARHAAQHDPAEAAIAAVVAPDKPQPIRAMVEAVVHPRGLHREEHARQVAALAAEVAAEAPGVVQALVLVVRRLVASNASVPPHEDATLQLQLHGAARAALEHAVSGIQDDVREVVELCSAARSLSVECAAFAAVGGRLMEAVQVAFHAARGGQLMR